MSKLVKKSSEHAQRKQKMEAYKKSNHLKNMTSQLTDESLDRAIGFMVITAILVGVSLILVLVR
jgi:hypothetical protein